jgi:hypothetical protein
MRIWREKSGKVGCLPSGLRYDFHGIGCRFTFTDQHSVDLDFGPNQRYDCFDEWRISHYIEGKKELSDGYDSDDRLAEEYKELIRQGIIVCPEWSIGGNLCCFKKSLKSLI